MTSRENGIQSRFQQENPVPKVNQNKVSVDLTFTSLVHSGKQLALPIRHLCIIPPATSIPHVMSS